MTSERGLTLLELTAALAIFSLIAVMGLQALSATVLLQDRLGARHSATWELGEALTRLRADFDALAPFAFVPPDGQDDRQPAFVADAANGRFSLSLAGVGRLPGTQETGLGRAEWRLDAASGTLRRRYWRDLAPFNASVAGPDQAILRDVSALQVRALTETGWVSDFGLEEAASRTRLPRAVEVTLRTGDHGDLRIVAAR